MIYLSHFQFPDSDKEWEFRMGIKATSYDTMYPFYVLSSHGLNCLDFEPITILYGGNGSGKTTALNVIADRLRLQRDTLYNRSCFFEDYVNLCRYDLACKRLPSASRIITSDDVFDFMLDLRSINQGVDASREDLMYEYLKLKETHVDVKSLDDFEALKRVNFAKKKSTTQSKFVRANLPKNLREHSNGESAFLYFTDKIADGALYLLDEPENSLSPERQIQLAAFLEESVRFFNCQLVISTHSPFLLSMRGAKIYDLDQEVADVKRWTDLKNVRAYYDFFKQHEDDFR